MNEIISHSVKNYAFFKDAKFDYLPGTQYVVGRNLNANSAKASNGSGKSSLFTSLYHVFDFPGPVVTEKRSITASSEPNSEFSFSFKRGQNVFDILKTKKSVSVIKNGKEIDLRTPTIARSYFKNLLPLTEEEFYSVFFLDSSRPDTSLQLASPVKRSEFFTSMFNDITEIDIIRKQVKKQLSDLQEKKRILERLRVDLSENFKNVRKSQIEEVTASCDKFAQDYNNLREELSKYNLELTKATSQLTIKPLVDKKIKLGLKLKVPHDKEIVVLKIKQLTSTIKKLKDYEKINSRYQHDVKKLDELKSSLLEKRNELGFSSVPELKKYLNKFIKYSSKLEILEDEPVEPTIQEEKIARDFLTELFVKTKVLYTAESLDKLEKLSDKYKSRFLEAQAHGVKLLKLKNLCEHEEQSECPTCTSSIDQNLLDELINKAAKLTNKREKFYKDLVSCIEWVKKEQEYRAWFSKKEELGPCLKFFEESIEKYGDSCEKLQKFLVSYEKFQDYKNSIEKPEVELDTSVLPVKELRLQNLNRLLSLIEDTKDFVHSTKNYSEEDLVNLKEKVKATESRLDKVSAHLRIKNSELSMLKEQYRNCVRIRKQISEIKAELGNVDELEILLEAYAPSGIKKLLLQRICKTFEDNLNRYKNFVFREKFSFECYPDDKGVNLLVHRPAGKFVRTSDVKFLSGAERRMFSWLKLLALLPMLPDKKRFDTIVLDEPDANLDDPMIEMFTQRFLPQLQKIVAKIVVITPNDKIITPQSLVTRVIKKGQYSSVVREL